MLKVNSVGRWARHVSTGSLCDTEKEQRVVLREIFLARNRRIPVQLWKIKTPLQVKANRCCKQGENECEVKKRE